MKYSDKPTEVADLIAVAGRAEKIVGVRSTDGTGPMWQALVRCNRTNLILAGLADNRLLWAAVKPGHDTLVWLVEDEPGHVVAHRTEDADAKGYKERLAEMTDEFDTLNAYYTEEVTAEDFEFDVVVSTDGLDL